MFSVKSGRKQGVPSKDRGNIENSGMCVTGAKRKLAAGIAVVLPMRMSLFFVQMLTLSTIVHACIAIFLLPRFAASLGCCFRTVL